MKRIIALALSFSICFLICSCSSTTNKRIVSKTPIKTEILGLQLCEAVNEIDIQNTLAKATDKAITINREKMGDIFMYRAYPISEIVSQIHYGTLSWNYIDVTLNKNGQIVGISFTGSYDSVGLAKKQYEAACKVFNQKYQEGNVRKNNHVTFWTDDCNTVGIEYEQSLDLMGNRRSYCTLYYVNISLSDEAKNSSIDV